MLSVAAATVIVPSAPTGVAVPAALAELVDGPGPVPSATSGYAGVAVAVVVAGPTAVRRRQRVVVPVLAARAVPTAARPDAVARMRVGRAVPIDVPSGAGVTARGPIAHGRAADGLALSARRVARDVGGMRLTVGAALLPCLASLARADRAV